MSKRKTPSPDTQAEVLIQSARRCCICFGLHTDFTTKAGQIAHLDGNSANSEIKNLAWLCLPHHDQYDTKTRQSKGLTVREVKKYRASLYEAVNQMRKGVPPTALYVSQDVPLLDFARELPRTAGIPNKGIRLTDQDTTTGDKHPLLYLSIHFKTSRFFGTFPHIDQRWLFIQADMRFALNLRLHVNALNDEQSNSLVRFLRKGGRGVRLFGPSLDEHAYQENDYLYVWRENGENRLMISTFTPTNAGISIHARLSPKVANAFADYLENIGFTKPMSR